MQDEENSNSVPPDSQNDTSGEDSPATESSDSETSRLKEQFEKLQSDMLYLKADFENYKKRVIKERSDLVKYGSENLVASLINLIDNFDRALELEIKPENLKSFSDGIKMISTEFKNTLGRFGVTEIRALGESFDPVLHEAVGTEQTEEFKPGVVCKVFAKPYKLHDRIIRPGKVIIAQEIKKSDDNG